MVKEIQQQARAILNFKSDAESIVQMKSLLDKLVKDGSVAVDQVTEKMKPRIDEIQASIKEVPFFHLGQTTRYLPYNCATAGHEYNDIREYLEHTRQAR
jgi:hypothetical protein